MNRKESYKLFILAVKTAAVLFLARERKRKIKYVIDPPAWSLSILFDNKFQTKGQIMAIKGMVGYKAALQIDFYDLKKNLTSVQEGTLKIVPRDAGYVEIKMDPQNPNAFLILFPNKAGATVLDWEADADRGEGVVTIKGEIAVEIQAGLAVGAADVRVAPLTPIEGWGTEEETTVAPQTTVDFETSSEVSTEEQTTVPETTSEVSTEAETTVAETTVDVTTEEQTTVPETTVAPEETTVAPQTTFPV